MTRRRVESPSLRTENLSVVYHGADAAALRNVSFDAAPGELIVVMGATGSGKSTLVNTLARIVPCFHAATVGGGLEVMGRQIGACSVRDLAGTVGVIFQDFEAQLFSTNVLSEVAFAMEHLGVPPAAMPGRAAAALAAVGLRDFGHRDPATLSGGEKQRLAIAGLLAIDPPILLLDEPTTDLDPVGKGDVLSLLGRLRDRGRTIVAVEHEIAAAEMADWIVFLRGGEVAAEGRPADILPQVGVFEACGVRPHDLAELFVALGVSDTLHTARWSSGADSARTYEAAHAALVAAGFSAPPAAEPEQRSDVEAQDGPPSVEAVSVSFEYEPGVRALDGVSVGFRAGEFAAIIGQNGSGKTTLAKHLAGLLRPTSGSVRLRGRDLHELPTPRRAAEVGFVFQDPDCQLFSASVMEEVAFGPRSLGLEQGEVAQRVQNALHAVGLAGREDADPFLLNKGARQRLAVASVLSLTPSVLILDEPTTGLDHREQQEMLRLLRGLNEVGTTIIIVTHSPWIVAEYAARGVLLAGGRVLWDGALRGLFERPDLLDRAAFRVPDVTALGQRFGTTALTVAELAHRLRRAR
jgi:energy-coupling factor transport system ATP-binding protein